MTKTNFFIITGGPGGGKTSLLERLAGKGFVIIDHLITLRYNRKVFIAPPWKEIYRNDSERDQTFEEAVSIYEKLYQWYENNGYQLLVLPKESPETRVTFVLEHVNA